MPPPLASTLAVGAESLLGTVLDCTACWISGPVPSWLVFRLSCSLASCSHSCPLSRSITTATSSRQLTRECEHKHEQCNSTRTLTASSQRELERRHPISFPIPSAGLNFNALPCLEFVSRLQTQLDNLDHVPAPRKTTSYIGSEL